MLQNLTEKFLEKTDITFDQAHGALNAVFSGKCTDIEIAAFLTALAAKGEKAPEVAGMAQALRDHAVPVRPNVEPLIDVVGTGGDGKSTFNISTIASLIVAGAGVHVAKHGNRAITSRCGSADLLAELGVKIDAAPAIIEKCIQQARIGFMFAPCHHPAMRFVQPVRKALGFRTAFNILGPLANPAGVKLQIIGVAKPHLLPVMADALILLGIKRAMIIHGDGIDELTTCAPNQIIEIFHDKLIPRTLDPADLGIPRADLRDLQCESPQENLTLTHGILDNRITGPHRDIVLLNAAAALMLAGKADSFQTGIDVAKNSLESGNAKLALQKLIEISNS